MTSPFLLALLACTGTTTTDSGDSGLAVGDPVDLLLVIDNSPSMAEEQSALVDALYALTDGLAGRDAQVHVMTIAVREHAGAHLGGVHLDNAGALADLEALVGGIALTGSGDEEGLEAVLEASCRAGGEVPDACFDGDSALTPVEADTSSGLWRDDNPRIAIVLTDEGDSSSRIALGSGDAYAFADIYDDFETPIQVTAIGPELDGSDNVVCAAVATAPWSAERYVDIAERTGLPYESLTDEAGTGGCDLRVEDALWNIADAL